MRERECMCLPKRRVGRVIRNRQLFLFGLMILHKALLISDFCCQDLTFKALVKQMLFWVFASFSVHVA